LDFLYDGACAFFALGWSCVLCLLLEASTSVTQYVVFYLLLYLVAKVAYSAC
jgi:hypothetical protein